MAGAVQLPTALHMHNSLLINEIIMGTHSLISSSATPCCCVCITILDIINNGDDEHYCFGMYAWKISTVRLTLTFL